jgi:hypothetical protein
MFQVKRLPCCCAAAAAAAAAGMGWDSCGQAVRKHIPAAYDDQCASICAYMLLLPPPLLSSVLQVHCGRRLQTKCLLLRSVCVRITLMLPVQHCQQRLWRAALYLVRYDLLSIC